MSSYVTEAVDHDGRAEEGYVSLPGGHPETHGDYVTHIGPEHPAGRYEASDRQTT